MAQMIGTVETFDSEVTSWSAWATRFNIFCSLNNVDDEDRKRQLLSLMIGAQTFKLLTDLISPTNIDSRSPQELLDTLEAHFTPKRLVIAERFKFYQRTQKEGESVTQYLAALRNMAKDCNFGQWLPEALRDKLVLGLNSEAVQRRLLGEENLELSKAVDLATSMEAASRDSKELNPQKGSVNQLEKRDAQRPFAKPQAVSKCFRCNSGGHDASACRFKDAVCHQCGKTGHIVRACRSKPKASVDSNAAAKQPWKLRKPTGSQHHVDEDEQSDCDVGHVEVNSVEGLPSKLLLPVIIDGKPLVMEVDTGAVVTLISEVTWRRLGKPQLHECQWKLTRYGKDPMSIMGMCDVNITLKPNDPVTLPLVVVKGEGSSLLGRNWISKLNIQLDKLVNDSNVNSVSTGDSRAAVDALVAEYELLFSKELGHCKDIRAKLVLKEGAMPRVFKPRPVPFALKDKVEADLTRLENMGVLTPIQSAEWAAPVVPVVKPNGSVRCCGDFKVTVNPWLDIDQYPLPRPDELFAALNGGHKFTKIDLSEAYLQVELDDESKKLLVINTHKGLYQCNRLMYGVASAPAIFQQKMDEILPRKDGIVVYMDDILVTGKDDVEHITNLRLVFSQLHKFGLRIKLEKCQFLQDSVEYLGRIVDRHGIHVSPRKISAIVDLAAPTDQSKLRSFMGMVNHNEKFLRTLADQCAPLNRLLKKDVEWKWTDEHQRCFDALKVALTSAPVLAHFDPALPIGICCDASPVGIGAVLFHRYPDGTERPISYASKTLTSAEQHYAQIEREGLGIIFGVRKFHQYLYGKRFILVTDHQPLVKIFGPKTGIPLVSVSRLQRWAIILAGYSYTIEDRRTNKMGNADGLSRLPMGFDSQFERQESFGGAVNSVQAEAVRTVSALTSKSIAGATQDDPTLRTVLKYIISGFPYGKSKHLSAEYRPYFDRREQLTSHDGCILNGLRIVIPKTLRAQVLSDLHEGHPGIVRMKGLARHYVWWPGIDTDVERVVNDCNSCQMERKNPPAAPVHLWETPSEVWDRIHIDFAGPFLGRMWLIVVDAKSGWPEVVEMSTTTSEKTIEVLREIFCRFGIPRQMVSDNGPQFTSLEFREFCQRNGVRHSLSSPYHPRSNGMAERFVQTFKSGVKMTSPTGKDLRQKLANFLLHYRITPDRSGKSPSELMFNRQIHNKLSRLRPDDTQTSFKEEGEEAAKPLTKTRTFAVNQSVWARNYSGNANWQQGEILKVLGPLSYQVQVGNAVWKRHCDQLRNRSAAGVDESHRQGVCVEMSPDDPHLWVDLKVETPAVPVGTVRPRPNRLPRQPVMLRDAYPLRNRQGNAQDPNGP